jgi:hypothetical protein
MVKCQHGVYNPEAPSPARYCTFCNPQHNTDRCFKPGPLLAERKEPALLDASDFMSQPVGVRLAQAYAA